VKRNVVVELSHLLRKDGGLGRKRLLSGLGRLRDVHELLRRGAEDGRWPHLHLPDAAALDAVRATAADLRARATTLVVVGQPGALAALRAVTDAVGEGSRPRWVSTPDSAHLAALDTADTAWLFLEGPAWVDRVAEWAVGNGRVVAMAGAGEHEAPPDGWWISDPVAGDGRFGALGMASLVCAAWAGVDVDSLVGGARDMAAACERPALLENPAYTLALATVFAERDLALSIPVHLATSGRLEAFAGWLVRMWGAVLSHASPVDGVVRHAGAAGVPGVVGDEELVQVLLVGPRDKFVTVWEPAVAPDALGGPEAVAQGRAFQELWDRENLPSLRVRLPGSDPGAIGAAILLAEHAAVTASLYQDLDPLGLAGVTAWYGAMDRARADVDADASTA
jgi:hypothetical protein